MVLGTKSERLRRARHALKQCPIAAASFNEALNEILTFERRRQKWTPLVEDAYRRLLKRERPAVRFMMMSFRSSCFDHAGLLRLMPHRFTGEFALVELSYVLDAAFALENMNLARKLAGRLPRAIRCAEHSCMKGWLLMFLSEICARDRKWDEAIAAAEVAQLCEGSERSAVLSIMDIHIARALRALEFGFRLIEQSGRNLSTKVATVRPETDEAVERQTAKEFARLRIILERIVPKERQKELGLCQDW